MKGWEVLKHDIECGILRRKRNWLIPLIAAPFLCAECYISVVIAARTMNDFFSTLGDYYLSILGGVPFYVIKNDDTSIFPVTWLIMNAMSAFVCLDYPLQDLYGFGQQVLVRSESRTTWWVTKCIWVVIQTTVYYALLYVGISMVGLALGATWSLNLSQRFIERQIYEVPISIIREDVLLSFCFPVLIGIAINMLQLLVTFLTDKRVGWLFSVIYYTVSVYCVSPVLMGNYSMITRMVCEASNELIPVFGIVLSVMAVVFVAGGGNLIFKKKDVLQKGRE